MKAVEASFEGRYPVNWEFIGMVELDSVWMPKFIKIDGIEYEQTDLINNGEPY